MTLAGPFRTERVEPFGVVSQKGGQQVEEEEILLSTAGPPTKPPCFFAPHAPFSLASHNAGDPHTAHNASAGEFGGDLDVLVHDKRVWLQSERSACWVQGCIPEA